jgi:hypothetical protein
MKRKDLLDGAKLLRQRKIEVDQISTGLAAKYVSDRRDGVEAAQASFDEWLDGDLDEDEAADLVGGEDADADPT